MNEGGQLVFQGKPVETAAELNAYLEAQMPIWDAQQVEGLKEFLGAIERAEAHGERANKLLDEVESDLDATGKVPGPTANDN